jgi:hypothetical protein
MSCGQFSPMAAKNTCNLPVLLFIKLTNLSFASKNKSLPVFYLFIRYIEVRMYLAICYPTYCCVAIPFQPSPCLNSYSFLFIYASKVVGYPNHQQLFWIFITFFLAGYCRTKFWETFNLYIKIIYPKFAPILRSQKSRFLMFRVY